MLGQSMNLAVEQGVLKEEDFMNKSERKIMETLTVPEPIEGPHADLSRLYTTFRTMTSIEHTAHALPPEDYFCVSLNVKQRYIDPLVGTSRLSAISPFAKKIIKDFKAFQDTPFGCVKLIHH